MKRVMASVVAVVLGLGLGVGGFGQSVVAGAMGAGAAAGGVGVGAGVERVAGEKGAAGEVGAGGVSGESRGGEVDPAAMVAAGRAAVGKVVSGAAGQMLTASVSGPGEAILLDMPGPGLTSGSFTLRFHVELAGLEAGVRAPITVLVYEGGTYYTLGKASVQAGGPANTRMEFRTSRPTAGITRIVMATELPAGATLKVQDLELFQHWLTVPQGGMVGGVLGTMLGVGGAAIGVLCVMGRYRGVAMGLVGVGLVVSGVSAVLGVAAWLSRQPYEVYYPLMVIGTVGLAVLLALGPVVRRGFTARETRRMVAVDAV